jgi:hypothetical protein
MNMHVSPPDPRRDAVVRQFLKDADLSRLTSKDLERQRPGNRAIVASRLEMLWQACQPHVSGTGEDGQELIVDFRYLDLGLKVLKALVPLLELDKEDPEEPDVGVRDRDPNAVKVIEDLDKLERRRLEGGSGVAPVAE